MRCVTGDGGVGERPEEEAAEEHDDGDEVDEGAGEVGAGGVQGLLLGRVRPRVVRRQVAHVHRPRRAARPLRRRAGRRRRRRGRRRRLLQVVARRPVHPPPPLPPHSVSLPPRSRWFSWVMLTAVRGAAACYGNP